MKNMQKQKIKMLFPQVVQMPAGEHEVIIADGMIFVAVMSGLALGAVATTPEVAEAVKPAVQKAAPKVVDDTKPAPAAKKPAPAAKAPVKKAPEPEPEETEEEESGDIRAPYTKIEDLSTLEIGQNVVVYMASEGLNTQMWPANVVSGEDQEGYEEGDGRVWVQFHADDQIDYLRPEVGDEVFEFVIGTQF